MDLIVAIFFNDGTPFYTLITIWVFKIFPSTVIAIPAEVKHWHGAAKDSWFQHLTYHRSATEETLGSSKKDVKEDASNEWLEPVTDEIYNKLP